MSLRLSSTRIASGQISKHLLSVGSLRSFQSGRALAGGKESDLHVEDKAGEIEKQKQEQLTKQKEGRGEWTDKLSSDSESIVKADRGEIKDANATIKQLQEDTARAAEREKKEGK